jgi:hypothetical protein
MNQTFSVFCLTRPVLICAGPELACQLLDQTWPDYGRTKLALSTPRTDITLSTAGTELPCPLLDQTCPVYYWDQTCPDNRWTGPGLP